MNNLFERMERFGRFLSESPVHMNAAEYRQWFQDREYDRSSLAETNVRGLGGPMPNERSIAIMERMVDTLLKMKDDPAELRNQAARDGITITD